MANEPTYEDYVDKASLDAAGSPEDGASIIGHLEELRWRIIWSLAAVMAGSVGCYYFSDKIVAALTEPAGKLYYMQPAEAFFAYLKVSVFGGFVVSLPVVLYHVWRFFLPALTLRERAVLMLVVPASVIFFVLGLLFAYFVALPAGLAFFLGFASNELQPLLSVGRYLDFVLTFIMPFGFVFELPLVIMVLAKLGIVSSAFLRGKRRMVIFGSFVVGAIVSPSPDIFNQTILALPIILLYEISVFVVRYILRK